MSAVIATFTKQLVQYYKAGAVYRCVCMACFSVTSQAGTIAKEVKIKFGFIKVVFNDMRIHISYIK